MFKFDIAPLPTGKIAENVYAVKTGTVNFFINASGESRICLDTGFGLHAVRRGLKQIGIEPGSVSHVFLTHSDFDHAGGLKVFGNAKVYISAGEEPMITGKKVRKAGVYNSIGRKDYSLLNDGEFVQAGEIRVRAISTPGHTIGSMSYLVDDTVLFSGDAFKLLDGRVCALRPYINMDTAASKASIQKLVQLENIGLACTAHWGATENFSAAIKGWKE